MVSRDFGTCPENWEKDINAGNSKELKLEGCMFELDLAFKVLPSSRVDINHTHHDIDVS